MEAWLARVVAADAGLYRRNAFRVGGLPVTATPRQVRRRAGEVRAAEALGVAAPTDPPTDSPPDYAAVREALRRLDDPVARVVDEFFWIWPPEAPEGVPAEDGLERLEEIGARTGPRLSGLAARRADSPEGASVARHNLAIEAHRRALEGRGASFSDWEEAYTRWNAVLRDEGCWRRVEGRIAALDDPRLRAVSAAALREALPGLLLAVHARVAVRAADGDGRDGGDGGDGADGFPGPVPGSPAGPRQVPPWFEHAMSQMLRADPAGNPRQALARQHIALMREFDPQGGAGADAALREATAPVAERLRLRTDQAAARPGDSAAALAGAAGTLLAESAPELSLLNAVLGESHPVAATAADSVATAALRHVVAAGNEIDPTAPPGRLMSGLVSHLWRARETAASAHVRAPIEQNLTVLLANTIGMMCQWAVRDGALDTRGGARRADRLLAEAAPLLRELRALRAAREPQPGEPDAAAVDNIHDAVAASAAGLLTAYFNTTHDVPRTLAGFRTALPVAAGAEGRSVIQRNIDTLTVLAATPGPAATAHAATPGDRLWRWAAYAWWLLVFGWRLLWKDKSESNSSESKSSKSSKRKR
jgi:hypothetical protein